MVLFLPALFQLFLAARAANYSYLCQPVDYSDDPNEVRVSVFLERGLGVISSVSMAVSDYGNRNTVQTFGNTIPHSYLAKECIQNMTVRELSFSRL